MAISRSVHGLVCPLHVPSRGTAGAVAIAGHIATCSEPPRIFAVARVLPFHCTAASGVVTHSILAEMAAIAGTLSLRCDKLFGHRILSKHRFV